jgi:hypothetical protein
MSALALSNDWSYERMPGLFGGMSLILLALLGANRVWALRYPRLSATGRGKHRAVAGTPARNRGSFLADQRGAVAFEMPFVYIVMMFSLLLPLADVAAAGFQFISAWEALRAFGQYVQYNPPADVTNPSWTPPLPTSVAGYPINSVQVFCGDTGKGAPCTSGNIALPTKYYFYTTTVTLTPMVLRLALCTSRNADPCSFTLPYSERFQ